MGPEETFVKLPRRTQRNAARSVGAHIASERQIHHMRLSDAADAGIRVLVALRDNAGAIVITVDEPEREDVDFATVMEARQQRWKYCQQAKENS